MPCLLHEPSLLRNCGGCDVTFTHTGGTLKAAATGEGWGPGLVAWSNASLNPACRAAGEPGCSEGGAPAAAGEVGPDLPPGAGTARPAAALGGAWTGLRRLAVAGEAAVPAPGAPAAGDAACLACAWAAVKARPGLTLPASGGDRAPSGKV
jgi:hypothetical protein